MEEGFRVRGVVRMKGRGQDEGEGKIEGLGLRGGVR